MDLTCFNWIQLIKKAELPANAKLIAFYLATFMNAEHDIAWPSQSRIASETGLTEPTVRKYLSVLNSEGWLITRKSAKHVNTGKQNYLHNEYLISVPEQRVKELLSGLSRGKTHREQRVNSQRAGGKEISPNNNVNNNRIYRKISFPHWEDNQAWEDLGRQNDLLARPRESWNDFKNRVKRTLSGE